MFIAPNIVVGAHGLFSGGFLLGTGFSFKIRVQFAKLLFKNNLPSSSHHRDIKGIVQPWVGTQSDIRDQRYRTDSDIRTSDIGLKCAESDIIVDIGINFCAISDIRHQYL
jgi:hypothetical protein